MPNKQREDWFRAKAEEAQVQAELARDALVRESWIRIAESYRYLASRQAPGY